jgi:predicted PurR-regulated permease PerM
MKHNNSVNFLLFCLIGSLVVVFFVIRPFLAPLVLAATFAYLFQPLQNKLLAYTKNHTNLAALLTEIIAIVIVLIPVTLLGLLILREASGLYQALAQDHGNFVQTAKDIFDRFRSVLPLPQDFEFDLSQYAKEGLGILTSNLGSIFSSIAQLVLKALVFLIAFYFLLKDGAKLIDRLNALSPLAEKDDALILSRLGLAVSSVVKGNLLVGLVQGTLSGIGFAIFGVPNAALWGGVAAIAALIPGIGTALVMTPAVAFLFLTDNTANGIGLAIWGATFVGLIDNFLGPKIVGRGMNMHPLAAFLSVMGGLALFGPLGFLLGPLAMCIFFTLIDIYFSVQTGSH